jgi:hypothetical protein
MAPSPVPSWPSANPSCPGDRVDGLGRELSTYARRASSEIRLHLAIRTEAMARVRMRSYMVLRLTPRRSAASSTENSSLVADGVVMVLSSSSGYFLSSVGVRRSGSLRGRRPRTRGHGRRTRWPGRGRPRTAGRCRRRPTHRLRGRSRRPGPQPGRRGRGEVGPLLPKALQVAMAAPGGSLAASFRRLGCPRGSGDTGRRVPSRRRRGSGWCACPR